MYTVKLWDKRELTVDDRTAKAIMEAISKGRAEAIVIKDSMYKLTAIASVEKSNLSLFDKTKAIASGELDRRANTDSEGYKKFMALRSKLLARK